MPHLPFLPLAALPYLEEERKKKKFVWCWVDTLQKWAPMGEGGKTLLGMGRDYDDRRKREIQLRMLSSSRETRPVWIIMSVGEA